MEHPDREVQAAITRLDDALCTWERATSRESVLIIHEQGGFTHRSVSGNPNTNYDISDTELFAIVEKVMDEIKVGDIVVEDHPECGYGRPPFRITAITLSATNNLLECIEGVRGDGEKHWSSLRWIRLATPTEVESFYTRELSGGVTANMDKSGDSMSLTLTGEKGIRTTIFACAELFVPLARALKVPIKEYC